MKKIIDKKSARLRRAARSRAKMRELRIARLTVHRTPRHMYAQIIDGDGGRRPGRSQVDRQRLGGGGGRHGDRRARQGTRHHIGGV